MAIIGTSKLPYLKESRNMTLEAAIKKMMEWTCIAKGVLAKPEYQNTEFSNRRLASIFFELKDSWTP